MDTYTFLRTLADSWVLLAMFSFFIGVIFWAFRPGMRATHADIALIPLRDDTAPACANCKGCNCPKGASDA